MFLPFLLSFDLLGWVAEFQMWQHPKSPRYFHEPAARLHPNPSGASNSCGQ